jgi:hypothetical protein
MARQADAGSERATKSMKPTLLHRAIEWIARAFQYESEQRYADECSHRPLLSDDEFIQKYFSSSGIKRDVPLRVRRVLAEQLGFEKIVPSDCPAEIIPDIDLQDVLDEIGEEFEIALNVEDLPGNDYSFGAMVVAINSRTN